MHDTEIERERDKKCVAVAEMMKEVSATNGQSRTHRAPVYALYVFFITIVEFFFFNTFFIGCHDLSNYCMRPIRLIHFSIRVFVLFFWFGLNEAKQK